MFVISGRDKDEMQKALGDVKVCTTSYSSFCVLLGLESVQRGVPWWLGERGPGRYIYTCLATIVRAMYGVIGLFGIVYMSAAATLRCGLIRLP